MRVHPRLLGMAAFALALCAPDHGHAGCGCDHPPPIQGYVFPRFGWVERPIAAYAPDRERPDGCVRVGDRLLTGGEPEAGLCAGGVRPQLLRMRYTARVCAPPGSGKGAAVRCRDTATALPPTAHVTVTDATDKRAVWFDGDVPLDGVFTIDAKRAGKTRLGAARATIVDGNGALAQQIDFDASCASPLVAGQQMGAFELIELGAEYETTADLSNADQAIARLVADVPGPKTVSVYAESCDKVGKNTQPVVSYPDSEFTMLSAPLPVIEREGTIRYGKVDAAVSADGTLLVPFDLTNVTKPMQFFVVLRDLPLRFGVDDVVYYNRDQYNLKLFERVVNGPEDFQWGPYFGTTVTRHGKATRDSNIIGYWRHEFESYRMAHLPGGTHAVGANGLHPDGTPHIDHNHIVLAIDGRVVDPSKPGDPGTPLAPGQVTLDVEVYQVLSAEPVDMTQLTAERQQALKNVYAVNFDAKSGMLRQVTQIGAAATTTSGANAAARP